MEMDEPLPPPPASSLAGTKSFPVTFEDERIDGIEEILESWTKFKATYDAKKPSIESRWTNCDPHRRTTLLHRAWNHGEWKHEDRMPAMHGFELDEAVTWRQPRAEVPTGHWDTVVRGDNEDRLLWPGINVADLTTHADAMLELLRVRASLPPRAFALCADWFEPGNERFLRSQHPHVLEAPVWRDHGDVRLVGMDWTWDTEHGDSESERNYGRLARPESREHLEEMQACEGFVSQPAAQWIARVQRRLYAFLDQLCSRITSGTYDKNDRSAAGSGSEANAPPFELRMSTWEDGEEAFRRSLDVYNDALRYSNPHEIDWNNVCRIADHQCQLADSRLRAMKEDPSKFVHEIRSFWRHSSFMMRSEITNTLGPFSREVHMTEEAWGVHIAAAIASMAGFCETWNDVFTALTKVVRSIKRTQVVGTNLSQWELGCSDPEFVLCMAWLFALTRYANRWAKPLARVIESCPQMRDKYRAHTCGNGVYYPHTASADWTSPLAKRQLPLVHMLGHLHRCEEDKETMLWTIVDEMYRYVKNDRRPEELISPHAMMQLETAQAMGVVVRALTMHQTGLGIRSTLTTSDLLDPQTCTAVLGDGYRSLERLQGLAKDAMQVITFGSADDASVFGAMCENSLAMPLAEAFAYTSDGEPPPPGVSMRAHADNMIRSETNLRVLWQFIERGLKYPALDALSDRVKHVLGSARPLVTAPVSEEEERAAEEEKKKKRRMQEELEAQDEPPAKRRRAAGRSAAAAPERLPSPVGIPAARPDEYLPRRPQLTFQDRQMLVVDRPINGQAATATLPDAPPQPPPRPATPKPKIKLRAKAYRTAEILLGPPMPARPGEVSWNDIRAFMAEIGFIYRQPKGGGSNRIFEPSLELQRTQGITTNVSKHTRTEIPTHVARHWLSHPRYGLAKYGWTFDKFELA